MSEPLKMEDLCPVHDLGWEWEDCTCETSRDEA